MNTGNGEFVEVSEEKAKEILESGSEDPKENIPNEEVPKVKYPSMRRGDSRTLFYVGEKLDIKGQPFEVTKIERKQLTLKPLPFPFLEGVQ